MYLMSEKIKEWLKACPEDCFLIDLKENQTLENRIENLRITRHIYSNQDNLYAVIKFKDLMALNIQ